MRAQTRNNPADVTFGDDVSWCHWEGSSGAETVKSILPADCDAIKVGDAGLLVRFADASLALALPGDYIAAGESGKVAVLHDKDSLQAVFTG